MEKTLVELDQQLIWHPYTQAQVAPLPIAITHAAGSYLYTESGHKLFDGISSWWTNSHGHCHPYINEAISRQAKKLEHVMFANFTHEPAIKLAQHLIEVAPKGLSRVFYSDNGATAVEIAIKMAFQYWHNKKQDRPYFIALEHSYHGDTFGAMAVSERSVFTKPFWPLLFNVIKTKSPCVSDVKADRTAADLTGAALTSLSEIFAKHQDQIAGVIIEPILQAAGGLRMFTKGFLSGIKDLCSVNDALLIADEVATGFYRTGPMFACEHENVAPDIMCVAKGLTGGYLPLAATLASEQIYQAFLSDSKADALLHGHSFTGNPLGCAAAIASFELFQKSETKEQIKNICAAIADGIKQFSGLSMVKNARSIGTIAAIELSSEQPGYLSRGSERVFEHCFKRGLFIRPLGNVIYIMPPLCSTIEEISWALATIKEGLGEQ